MRFLVRRILWHQLFGKKKYAVANDDDGISATHDYIIVFQKTSSFKRQLLLRTEKQKRRYQNPDNDPRGQWSSSEYVSSKSKAERPTLWYSIINPKTKQEVWPDENAVWRYSKEMHEEIVNEERLYWGPNFSYKKPRLKRFLNEIQEGVVPGTWWPFEDVGHNDEGQKETAEIIGKKVFSTPKPVRVINKILSISTLLNESDIILDFFAGSATTAQAVLELNKEDNGNRKFILVQLPEPCDENSEAFKAGYKTIADISKERIRRVLKKLNAQTEEAKKKKEGELKFDNPTNPVDHASDGFKVFKLSPSNFKIWRGNDITEENLVTQLDAFANPVKEESKTANMLYELMLKAGYSLTDTVEAISILWDGDETGGLCNLNVIADGELIIVLDNIDGFTIEEILERNPKKLIVLDSLFKGNDQLKTNTVLQMRDAGIDFKTI